MGQSTLLLFRIADRRLALPLAAVRSVVPVPLLEPPVGAPAFVEGFFDLAGIVTAAIRLDRLFGFGEQRLGIYAPLLVLADSEPPLAIHVDKVDRLARLDASHIQPLGADESCNGCLAARFDDDTGSVYVLAAERLLFEVERQRVAAHTIMRQQRVEALDAVACA